MVLERLSMTSSSRCSTPKWLFIWDGEEAYCRKLDLFHRQAHYRFHFFLNPATVTVHLADLASIIARPWTSIAP